VEGARGLLAGLMAQVRPDYQADAAVLLWKLLAIVVVVGGLLLALLIVVGDGHRSSGDPVLLDATGYGRYVGSTETALVFSMSCATSTVTNERLVTGSYLVPTAHLTIEVEVARGGGRTPVLHRESVSSFRDSTATGTFRGYVTESGSTSLVTDAPGSGGCAGTITASGGLS